jgi:hypothetical protein
VSGLGKGVTASSIGVLLKACGHRVTSIKIGGAGRWAPHPLHSRMRRTEGRGAHRCMSRRAAPVAAVGWRRRAGGAASALSSSCFCPASILCRPLPQCGCRHHVPL